MTDLSRTIAPKSDQMNADDLIAGPLTIRITKVSLCQEPEQPIAVNYESDDNKPYKPCKSMRRVLVNLWGPDGNAYPGRSLTLYRDPEVQFGGMKVGGIRISHASDIKGAVTMALTATRANRKPFTVRPLAVAATAPAPAASEPPKRTIRGFLDALKVDFQRAESLRDVQAILARDDVRRARDTFTNGTAAELAGMIEEATARFAEAVSDESPVENDPALDRGEMPEWLHIPEIDREKVT